MKYSQATVKLAYQAKAENLNIQSFKNQDLEIFRKTPIAKILADGSIVVEIEPSAIHWHGLHLAYLEGITHIEILTLEDALICAGSISVDGGGSHPYFENGQTIFHINTQV